jgi:hypothetical protein
LRSLIQSYRACPVLGWGEFQVFPQLRREVLAHQCTWQGSSTVALHNLSPHPITTQLELDTDHSVRLDDLFDQTSVETGPRGTVELGLAGYGHRWLRLRRDAPPVR